MGFKLSIVLFILLAAVTGGSAWLLERQQEEIAVLKGNAIVLESKISEQNESIKGYLQRQEETQQRLDELTTLSQDAQREVNRLRATFARHDLDALALAKPKMIEKRVNAGTQRVNDELKRLTDPEQFNETDTTPDT